MSENFKKDTLLASTLLEAKNISHNFDYELFKNINISLHKKESIAIIGTSGSGKSTLLNVLSSLLKPTIGNVVFQSKDIYKLKQNDLLKIRRDDFGIIFQAHYLFRGFSAFENLQIATLLSKNNLDNDLLKALNIEHIINQGVGELSGGQQQRLSIARILMKKPKIIFADEPTGNLDKDTANIVMDSLFDYIKNYDAGLILVTHEHDLAFKCDKVYKLEDFSLREIIK
ncbi:ABC transporter ATP-binding protein [Aliarcobacter vitoriensis]|uniref:ABC transporter ATP-binding protein n=1 Tax=Aliarcobacter vitoriensis TaxID=2011099 RepID=A0A366MS90_9BACT|nr:ABC transporter ATP-binding protein [Aliarcobacter vitoriensis]RBQ28369.1 ABC transporter ATP-binding protein [Aliarcobacter vitoriensis]RBQ32326.1 ABC transporter ATP-binding protein [Arcobacter sp. FW59]